MPQLNLKPAHKAVREYYKSLGQFDHQHATHEMAVRTAFQGLLRTCAKQFDWTLVPEYPIRRAKAMPLKVDGALLDTFRLTHGFWEAKDEHDELEREVEHKLSLGYPDKNIIFQSPRSAILVQRGRVAWRDSIAEPDALVEVLHHFFDYSDPEIMGWEEAANRFKAEVPEQSRALKELIDEQRKKNRPFVEAFSAFVETCRQALNPNLSEDAVERMLIQHLLTERIFSKVFDNEDFRTRNVVAVEIEKVIAALIKGSFNRSEFLRRLDPFYKAIELSAANTSGYTEKQEFLNTVYERFFQGFSPKEADTHGIVYTPQPIVDFMVRSVEDILEKEFGKSLAERGVHILDPFVGTGNFIVRIMKEIAAKKKSALPYKYREELHCNEVMLLPYYIASMNIEHEYLEAMGEYEPFPGICLVDTFDVKRQSTAFAEENARRIAEQNTNDIFVVVGNPPYNAWQENEDDNNKNLKYPKLDALIVENYVKPSRATNKNALWDMYVRAFRWASDRIADEGIIALVSNNGFLDGLAFDGMRKSLAATFSEIYHFNLKGNARTSGDRRRREGGNIFDDSIRVGIGITLLVKKVIQNKAPARVYIFDVPDYLGCADKQAELEKYGSYGLVPWRVLQPERGSDWYETQNDLYKEFLAIGCDNNENGVFRQYSNGVKTNRDAWAYNFHVETLTSNVRTTIEFYNSEVDRWKRSGKPNNIDDFVQYDASRISWSRDLKQDLARETYASFDNRRVVNSLYRPFCQMALFFDQVLNEEVYSLPKFHLAEHGNTFIALTGPGSEKPFLSICTDRVPDIHTVGAASTGQCFPFYTYDEDGTNRRENITDWALEQFRSHYADPTITKWDIFHYVYAVLHHPTYRERYAANLKRELPRVPFVKSVTEDTEDAEVFRTFVKAGERLADLHVNYERQPDATEEHPEPGRYGAPRFASTLKPKDGLNGPPKWLENPQAKLSYRVEKMRLSKDKTTLAYNEYWTLVNIPAEVYEYRLGNRSALEWIMDQYQVSTDKRSGITNDPNREDDPEYVKRLIGQVIYVSLETVKIVKALPEWGVAQTAGAQTATC